MIGKLPTHLNVCGKNYSIRTHYKDILKILCAFNDPELADNEKIYVCLFILFKDFNSLPETDYGEAFKKALEFIDQNTVSNDKPSPRVMDWEQDENIMFPAINKVAGFEVRRAKYIHWWTFLGYYMEISDGIFAHVLELRSKKARGKKLEKHEQEFWNNNKSLCVLNRRISAEEQEEINKLNELIG